MNKEQLLKLENERAYDIMCSLVNDKILLMEEALRQIDRQVFEKTNMRAAEFLEPGSPEREMINRIINT